MSDQIIKIKFCKTCGCSSETNKFHSRECVKCKSKKCNAKLNEKNYYSIYWLKHASGLPRGPKPKIIKEIQLTE
jgi:hypothetical protein